MRQSLGHLGDLYLAQDSWVGTEGRPKLLALPVLWSGSIRWQPTQSNIKREQLTPQPQDSQTQALSPGEREEN